MRKVAGKKLAAAVILGLSLSLAGMVYAAPANSNSVTVQVDVQQTQSEDKGIVNWEKGSNADVVAVGVGLPPENMPAARGKWLARRAAIVDAQRNLVETVQGVQVDAETTMQNLVIVSDTVKTKVSAMVKGARIIEEKANEDGSYMVKLSIPLYGVSGVAGAAIPEITKNLTPQPVPAPTAGYAPAPQEQKTVMSYTGVIVDAAGLGLEATFAPVIFDVNGRVVYGIQNIDYNLAISQGMVEYSGDVQQAAANSRAGSNALVVKALSVKGGKNSVNPVNVVVSVEDADKILYANQNSGMLNKRAVVFVK